MAGVATKNNQTRKKRFSDIWSFKETGFYFVEYHLVEKIIGRIFFDHIFSTTFGRIKVEKLDPFLKNFFFCEPFLEKFKFFL